MGGWGIEGLGFWGGIGGGREVLRGRLGDWGILGEREEEWTQDWTQDNSWLGQATGLKINKLYNQVENNAGLQNCLINI